MLGAIIGDVVGSRFEFHNYRSKKFDLFSNKCFFTDDTVMTCAIAKALVDKQDIVKTMVEYGKKYPRAGYGGRFMWWLFYGNHEPYYSFGNGAAMRVSACAYMAHSEKEVKMLSRKVTAVTHDHPEGLKGAEVTAVMIYKALNGVLNKEELREYALNKYPEIANFDLKELRKTYKFNETCQETVPQAIYCFLISKSFEDCLRTSVSIGGDTDTLCAISCAIAEAYYGIPKKFKKAILKYFSEEDKETLLKPVIDVYNYCGIKDYFTI